MLCFSCGFPFFPRLFRKSGRVSHADKLSQPQISLEYLRIHTIASGSVQHSSQSRAIVCYMPHTTPTVSNALGTFYRKRGGYFDRLDHRRIMIQESAAGPSNVCTDSIHTTLLEIGLGSCRQRGVLLPPRKSF